MALPKKNSRLISIDGVIYRWMVGPNDGFNLFYAEKEGVKRCKLKVYFEMNIDPKSVDSHGKENLIIIKPKEAEHIIRQALSLGWNPEEAGKPIVFDLKGDTLIKRT